MSNEKVLKALYKHYIYTTQGGELDYEGVEGYFNFITIGIGFNLKEVGINSVKGLLSEFEKISIEEGE